MSTMNVHTPEPGWLKRWAKEGAELLIGCPAAIVFYVALLPVSGVGEMLIRSLDAPHFIQFPMLIFLHANLVGLLVALMSREFYRREGFGVPPIAREMFRPVAIQALQLMPGMILVGALFSLLPGDADAERSFAESAIYGYTSIFAYILLFTPMGHALPILSASGMSRDEATHASKLAHEKLKSMVTWLLSSLIVIGGIILAFNPISVPLGALFVAMAYVGSREIIGGPGAKEAAREEARSTAAQAT